MKFDQNQRNALLRMLGNVDPVTANEWINYLEQMDLNPFLGDAVVLGRKVRGVYITNKGLLKLLQRSGKYNGHEYEWGFDKDGNLMYVDVKLYLKGIDHPVVERAWLRDYLHLINNDRASMAWKTSMYDMLAVKAMNKAIRRGLGLNVTSAEEVMDESALKEYIQGIITNVVNNAANKENNEEKKENEQHANNDKPNQEEDYTVLVLRWLSDLSKNFDKQMLKELYSEAMKNAGLTSIETKQQYEYVVNYIAAKLQQQNGGDKQ